MCVLAFSWGLDPRRPLVLAGNRDERHDRPSAPLAAWPGTDLLAGRDMLSGGTWLGVSGRGVAVVTNVRTGLPATGATRGVLVPEALAGRLPDPAAARAMNPFNLLVFDATGARFVTNRPAPDGHSLVPGHYALANAGLDECAWRTDRLKAALTDGASSDALFDALADRIPGPDGAQAVFIVDPVYGTRCSTVVTVDGTGTGRIVERRFDADGQAIGETALAFTCDPAMPRG